MSTQNSTPWQFDHAATRALSRRYPHLEVAVRHAGHDCGFVTRTLQVFVGGSDQIVAAGLADTSTLEQLLTHARDGRHRQVVDEFGTSPSAYVREDGRIQLMLRHLAPDHAERGMHGVRMQRQFRRLWKRISQASA